MEVYTNFSELWIKAQSSLPEETYSSTTHSIADINATNEMEDIASSGSSIKEWIEWILSGKKSPKEESISNQYSLYELLDIYSKSTICVCHVSIMSTLGGFKFSITEHTWIYILCF